MKSQGGSLPRWWIEVPDPMEYRGMLKPSRTWKKDDDGYCNCLACTNRGKNDPAVISLEKYRIHWRDQQRERRQRNRMGSPTPAKDPIPANVHPVNASFEIQPVVQTSLPDFPQVSPPEDSATDGANVPVFFDLEGDEPYTVEVPSWVPIPPPLWPGDDEQMPYDPLDTESSPDSPYLKHIVSPGWTDFFNQFATLARPVERSLLPVPRFKKTVPPPLDVLEHVLYSIGMALVAQWNVPHSAIQFCLTQIWNIYRYGLIVGRHHSNPLIRQPILRVDPGSEILFAAGSTALGVRTFRGLQRHLDIDGQDLMVVHAACTNEDCEHVFYNITKSAQFKSGATCTVCNKRPDKEGNVGLVPFPRMPLATALQRFFDNEGVEKMCEEANDKEHRTQEWDRLRHGQKIYRQASSGSAWQLSGMDGQAATEGADLVLRIAFGIDFYQVSRSGSARLQSVGPILATVTNLPLKLRGKLKLALLLGVIPGPKEINREHLYHYLLPLTTELRQARLGGLMVATSRHPQGRRIFVQAGPLCCDAPARCMVTGGPWHSRWGTFCIRCNVNRDDLITSGPQWTIVNTPAHTGKVYAERLRVRERIAEETTQWNLDQIPIIARRRNGNLEPRPFPKSRKKDIAEAIQHTPGHPTAFDIVPFFDKFVGATFDPMHMLCMGVIPVFYKNIMYVGDRYRKGLRPKDRVPKKTADGGDEEDGGDEDDGRDEGDLSGAEGIVEPDDVEGDLDAGVTSRPGPSRPTASSSQPAAKASQAATQPPTQPFRNEAPMKNPTLPLQPLLTPKQRETLHDLMEEVKLPPRIDPISAHTFFLGESGRNTAAQWRTFARYYAPFVVTELWTTNEAQAKGSKASRLDQEELEPLLLVAEITDLALRTSISEKQIDLLRTLIKRLQDSSYRDRPTIYRCSNLHWLSHLPDDIERYGPVYSWWLFVFERMNKLLKSANANGRAADTPLIAMNKFIRLGMLERLANFRAPTEDLGASYLADKSAEAFAHAFAGLNMTEEERDAILWVEEGEDNEPRQNGPNRPRENVVKVTGCREQLMSLADRQEISSRWNASPSRKFDVKPLPTISLDCIEPVLQEKVRCWTHFYIGSNYFVLPEDNAFPVKSIKSAEVMRYWGAYVEWRPDTEIFSCISRPTYVGILEGMYEIEATDGKHTECKRFLKFHLLMPYVLTDPYKFRERLPSSNLWLYEPTVVRTVIRELRLGDLDIIRPVVLKQMPLDPGNPGGLKLLGFKGINHR